MVPVAGTVTAISSGVLISVMTPPEESVAILLPESEFDSATTLSVELLPEEFTAFAEKEAALALLDEIKRLEDTNIDAM